MTILFILIAALFAGAVGLRASAVGQRFGLIDHPDPHGGRKRHARPTPLVGGIAILPPALLMCLWLSFASYGQGHAQWADIGLIGLCTAMQAALGLVDDRIGLRPLQRLLISLAVFALTLTLATSLEVVILRFTNVLPSLHWGELAAPFTILCLVGLLNAVNMADGKNGLVIGLCMIWTFCLWMHGDTTLQPLFATLMTALGVALLFNWRGRFFLGDAGSYGLATLIGLLAIEVYANGSGSLKAGHIAVWFAVPTIDCLRLMIRRLRAGRSPFSGDREHLHHHLGRLLGWPRSVFAYWAMVGVPSVAALIFPVFDVQILLAQLVLYALVIVIAQRAASAHAA
ncbi:glycosyltransferase family 4 protein [Parapedomonas caeni]